MHSSDHNILTVPPLVGIAGTEIGNARQFAIEYLIFLRESLRMAVVFLINDLFSDSDCRLRCRSS
jgi:hypothetical protein